MPPTAHILLVEDDDGVREAVAELLEDEGFAVATARNGVEGLAYLADHPAPDLILLDLMMPVLDGQGFREAQLRDPRLAAIPTIVLSAAHSQPDQAMDGAAWLAKPMSAAALLQTIARHQTRRGRAAADHLCVLYRDGRELIARVADYLAPAVEAGDGVLVVISQEHGALLEAELRLRQHDPDLLRGSGQLTRFDAAACLAEITGAGGLDLDRLDRRLRPAISTARARFGRLRAYGHLVDLLWQRGDLDGALAVEGYWNGLLQDVHFPLLCAYSMTAGAGDLDAARAHIDEHHVATRLIEPAAA